MLDAMNLTAVARYLPAAIIDRGNRRQRPRLLLGQTGDKQTGACQGAIGQKPPGLYANNGTVLSTRSTDQGSRKRCYIPPDTQKLPVGRGNKPKKRRSRLLRMIASIAIDGDVSLRRPPYLLDPECA